MRALILLLILNVFTSPVWAVEVADLYESEMAVSGQGRTERHKAVRMAFAEVLIKISGNEQVALLPGIPELLGRSIKFLEQYRYRTEAAKADARVGSESQQWLWMRFNQAGLDKALREIAVPIWGHTRPNTLLWLAVEQAGQRSLHGGGVDSKLLDNINLQAKRRGIPLVLPLLDLEDQQQINATDVWSNFQDNILKASKRYPTEAILVGRLLNLGRGRWQARWNLNLGGQLYDWTHTGLFESALSYGIEGTASVLASKFVRVPDNKSEDLRVLIKDIRNLADFARSERYLSALNGVIKVHAAQLDSDRILFSLKTRGDRQALLEAVRLSSRPILVAAKNEIVLSPDSVNLPVLPIVQPADIVFRLLP